MSIRKHVIHGEKGKTVCYTIPDFVYDETRNQLQWGAFRLYTPEGSQEDNDGFRYFDVPADSVEIIRDGELNKMIAVMATCSNGLSALELFEGAEYETILIGLEGDIFVSVHVPPENGGEIVIDYKEVTNG